MCLDFVSPHRLVSRLTVSTFLHSPRLFILLFMRQINSHVFAVFRRICFPSPVRVFRASFPLPDASTPNSPLLHRIPYPFRHPFASFYQPVYIAHDLSCFDQQYKAGFHIIIDLQCATSTSFYSVHLI